MFIIVKFWRLELQDRSHWAKNHSVGQAAFPSRSSGRQSVFLAFPASRGCLHSLAHGPSLQSQRQQQSIFQLPSDSASLVFLFWGPLWLQWAHQITESSPHHKILNLVTSAKYKDPFAIAMGWAASVRTKSLQQCLSVCDPMNCSPPGSSDHRIL